MKVAIGKMGRYHSTMTISNYLRKTATPVSDRAFLLYSLNMLMHPSHARLHAGYGWHGNMLLVFYRMSILLYVSCERN